MSSGTFGYPLCFSAMLVAIGLMVSPRPDVRGLTSNDAVPVARKECGPIATKPPLNHGIDAKLIERCNEFIRKYPDSNRIEDVMGILGESLVRSGNWKEVGAFYLGLEARFPKSENLDRFVFFQALAFFQDANFTESITLFNCFLKNFPRSSLVENASYYLAMSYFLGNNYKEALAACGEHLRKFPHGRFAGDMCYRIAFIDFNDKEDKSEKLICDLSDFLKEHPDDVANGSMYCLMADTYKRMGKQDQALDSYIKALWTESPDDVLQYALDSATVILRERNDWYGIAKLRGEIQQRKPWLVLPRKNVETVVNLAQALETCIADPAQDNAEIIIDDLVKSLTRRKKRMDIDAVDKQFVEILNKSIDSMDNPTIAARICYARARLAEWLKRKELSDLYLKTIAITNAKNPPALSPTLLAICGDILLKSGDVDGAEAMFQWLKDQFSEAICGDAGLVGLGYVALARKKPEEALGVFEQALKKPNNMRFKEAMLGKLEALVDLGQFEEAIQLALQIVGDKMFRGETVAKAYLLLGQAYRGKSAKAPGEETTELLKKAHGIYHRVCVAYQAYPDLCAEGYWQAAEVAKDLGDEELSRQTLRALLDHPKLKNTSAYKKAVKKK